MGNVSAMSLRSGRELPQNAPPADAESKPEADSSLPKLAGPIPLPFPNQTLSTRKFEVDEDLLKMLWKKEINISLLDAIKQIPKYAKFLKELYVHKRGKMKGKGGVKLSGIVSVLTKYKATAGPHQNLPKKKYCATLWCSRDVLVQVNKLILGWPFFMTAQTNIDVHVGTLSTKFDDNLEEKLLQVLKQYKKAIGWKLSDLLDINPSIYMHRILMEEEARPLRQQQRRMNPTILDAVKKEVTKLLAVGIIYPISNRQWVSPVQVVPKISRMNVLKNQHDELVTRKDHFPFPFIDQVLEKLAGKSHYCFLDGFSGYMQIYIAPEDQHKTTFTCPFGTFGYTRMSFGLCNGPSTFQWCMTSIFSNLLQDYMEVLMDDFMVYVESFDACLENLSQVLTRCIDTNLVLNFEKCHFMVIEGIILGDLVSSRGIKVYKCKIDIIISLPNPAYVQEVHSFIGHVGFYRRFINNFSKIALLMSKLLQKDVDFNFEQPCVKAFQELKTRLTSASIVQAPNWDYPFELMCDASNLALKVVLGQRAKVGKQAHVIAYVPRKMDPAYTVILVKEARCEVKTNSVDVDHLSQIERESDPMPIPDEFPNEQLLQLNKITPCFANICNFIVASQFPQEASWLYKEKLKSDARYYIWDDPYLCRLYNDQIIHGCILDSKIKSVLQFCHATSGGDHYGPTRIAQKLLDCGFYWPTIFRDVHQFVSTCK
ncbi:Retrovirus-related Pol polyprotein, partial [Mucuna pruriens]